MIVNGILLVRCIQNTPQGNPAGLCVRLTGSMTGCVCPTFAAGLNRESLAMTILLKLN